MRLSAVFLCLQSFEVCCLMMASRAPRPLTSKFLPQTLAGKLAGLAKVRGQPFDWDGTGYQGGNRSNLGDPDSLAKHMGPLTIILTLCNTGFPSHPNLRQALTILHTRYQIFKDCSNVFKVAYNAAAMWRLMCRHIYNRRKEGDEEPSLQSLISLIVLPSSITAEDNVPASEQEEADTTVPGHHSPSSHVQTVSALVPTNNTLASPQPDLLQPDLVNSLFPTFDSPADDDDDDDDPEEDDCIMLGYSDPEVSFITQQCMCPACRPTKATPPETPTSKTFRH